MEENKSNSKGIITTIIIIVLILGGAIFAFSKGSSKQYTNYPVGGTGTTTTTDTTATTTQKTFTLADVAKHNTEQDCYTVVSGSVYNVTSWISQHPGGKRAILGMCGIDATSAFIGQHGGQARPEQELATFKIGILAK